MAGTAYDIFVDDIQDPDFLQVIAERMNEIAGENVPGNVNNGYKPDPEDPNAIKPCRGFYVAPGRVTFTGDEWGAIREIQDDVIELSREYKDSTIKVVYTRPIDGIAGVEDLGNFWRADYENGIMVDSFKAEPVTWQSNTRTSWFI